MRVSPSKPKNQRKHKIAKKNMFLVSSRPKSRIPEDFEKCGKIPQKNCRGERSTLAAAFFRDFSYLWEFSGIRGGDDKKIHFCSQSCFCCFSKLVVLLGHVLYNPRISFAFFLGCFASQTGEKYCKNPRYKGIQNSKH